MLTATSHDTLPSAVQVQHARDGNAQWKLQPAGFGKRRSLLVESKKELRTGARLTMDFGVDKTDAQILLDYGVLDSDSPQVRLAEQAPTHALDRICFLQMWLKS